MTMHIGGMGRLGIVTIYRDNRDTWSLRTGRLLTLDRRRAYFVHYGLPTIAAAAAWVFDLRLAAASDLLPAVAVFTALLFALLGLAFNTGVSIQRDRGSRANATAVLRVIADLRANVTYAIVIAFALAVALLLAASFDDLSNGVSASWAPIAVWLFVHLGLSLGLVLKRFRTAFNAITRLN